MFKGGAGGCVAFQRSILDGILIQEYLHQGGAPVAPHGIRNQSQLAGLHFGHHGAVVACVNSQGDTVFNAEVVLTGTACQAGQLIDPDLGVGSDHDTVQGLHDLIVHALGAVDDGASLNCHQTGIGGDILIGVNTLGFHGEVQVDHIASGPLALQNDVAVLIGSSGNILTVDADTVFILCPLRQAEAEGEFALAVDGHGACTVPGHSGLHLQVHQIAGNVQPCGVADVLVDGHGAVSILGVDIAADGQHGTHQVGRTAGGAEPVGTQCALVGLQGVGIEELVAVQIDAGQDRVIQNLFQNIDVLAVAVEQVHSLVPHHICDLGAGFAVSIVVGQLIASAEGFRAADADTAGNILLGVGHILPDGLQSGIIGIFTAGSHFQQCHIGHTGVHILGTDAVAVSGGHLGNGSIMLHLGPGITNALAVAVAAPIQEVLCHLDIACSSGAVIHAVENADFLAQGAQLNQRQLDFLMTGRGLDLALAGTDGTDNQVSVFHSHIQQPHIAGGTVVRNGSFIEMACAVQLMGIGNIRGVAAGNGVQGAVGMDGHIIGTAGKAHAAGSLQGEGGIQIAVSLLGAFDPGDPLFQLLGNDLLAGNDLFIALRIQLQGVAHGLNNLVVIGVHINGAAVGGCVIGGVVAGLGCQIFGCLLEVQHTAAGSGDVPDSGGNDLADELLLSCGPECVFHLNLAEGHGMDIIHLLQRLLDGDGCLNRQVVGVGECVAGIQLAGKDILAGLGAVVVFAGPAGDGHGHIIGTDDAGVNEILLNQRTDNQILSGKGLLIGTQTNTAVGKLGGFSANMDKGTFVGIGFLDKGGNLIAVDNGLQGISLGYIDAIGVQAHLLPLAGILFGSGSVAGLDTVAAILVGAVVQLAEANIVAVIGVSAGIGGAGDTEHNAHIGGGRGLSDLQIRLDHEIGHGLGTHMGLDV